MVLEKAFAQVGKNYCYVSMVVGARGDSISLSPLVQKIPFETTEVASVASQVLLLESGVARNRDWLVWLDAQASESESSGKHEQVGEGRRRQGCAYSVAALGVCAKRRKGAVAVAMWQVARSLSSYSMSVLVFPPAFGHEWHCEIA
jgi:hypothetical protein